MAAGTGISGQIGIAPESTFGTYVAPTKFLRTTKTSIKPKFGRSDSTWIGVGPIQLDSSSVRTTREAAGQVELDVVNKGFGLLLQCLMGTTVTPVQQGATPAYLQTHTLNTTTDGKSLSLQAGIPDTTGTVRPYTYLGTKVTGATFNVEVSKTVTAQFDVDCRDVTESQTLASASYSTNVRPFVGTDTAVKVGTFGAEAAVLGVTKASVKIDRNPAQSRFYLGQAGLKAEQISQLSTITGTLDADYVDKTIFVDRFMANTSFSLVIEAVGLLISGIYFDTFRITLPCCRLDGDVPLLDSNDVVNGSFPFTYRYDGTNQAKIEYISTDVTV